MLFWKLVICCALMVGGLGSFADGMFTTNRSSQSVIELLGPDTGEMEGYELMDESVVLSCFSEGFRLMVPEVSMTFDGRLLDENDFFASGDSPVEAGSCLCRYLDLGLVLVVFGIALCLGVLSSSLVFALDFGLCLPISCFGEVVNDMIFW